MQGQKPLEEMSGHHLSGDLSGGSGQFPPMLDPCSADSKEFWVHEECAAWSKTVYLFGHRLRGLEDTILQAVDKVNYHQDLSPSIYIHSNKFTNADTDEIYFIDDFMVQDRNIN